MKKKRGNRSRTSCWAEEEGHPLRREGRANGGNKTRKRVEIEEPRPATTDKAGRAGRRSVWKERREGKSEAIAEFSVCCSPPT